MVIKILKDNIKLIYYYLLYYCYAHCGLCGHLTKWGNKFLSGYFFPGAHPLGRIEVSAFKIAITLFCTFKKLYCKENHIGPERSFSTNTQTDKQTSCYFNIRNCIYAKTCMNVCTVKLPATWRITYANVMKIYLIHWIRQIDICFILFILYLARCKLLCSNLLTKDWNSYINVTNCVSVAPKVF